MPFSPRTPAEMAEMRAKRDADRAAAEVWQREQATIVGLSVIQPAIGRTGGVDNVGWEVLTPGRQPRYYGTRELAHACASKELEHAN